MTKSLTTLLTLALCLSAIGQQPDDPDQDQPQENPTPADLLRQLVPQNGDTNGATQEALAELLRAAVEAQQANGENRPDDENSRPDSARGTRPIRGQGTRGTMGSSTNAQPLATLLNGTSTNQTANGKGLRLNFRNAPLSLVLDYLSDAAGLVISANSKVDLKGTVTVWSNQLVDRTEAIRLLNASLNSSGYAATVEGSLLNIYVVDATTTPIEVGIPDDYTQIPATKDLVTQIVYVRNVEPSQLITSLQPLMPAGTSMSANQGANAILITDTKANIRRMAQLVKALDTSSVSASEMRVIPLEFADPTALAQIVTQLFQTDSNQGGRNRGGGFGGFPGFGNFGGGDRGRGDNNSGGTAQSGRVAAARVTAVADERSNALVVSAPADRIEEIEKLVRTMDVNVDDLTELRVFRLRYADPQETADQLTNLFPDPTTQQNSRNQQFGFRGFNPFGGGQGGNNNNRNTGQESRSAKQTRVTAVPDPRTGSVIVSAAQQMMGQIADIIAELDSDPAKQKKVYVIKVENRDPQEVVQELQSVISADSSANVNTRNNNQSGSQLNTRQQNNLQNQGNNTGFNSGFGTGGNANRTGR